MLPSSGYFQSVPCPFYNNGLCERHHCQYRHVKKEILGKILYNNLVDESLVTSTSDDGRKSDLLKMVDIAIQKAQQDVERNKAALEAVKYSSLKGPDKAENAFPVNYTPTPVSMCVLQKEKPISKNLHVPEYRPTPIAELKKLQKLSEKEYDPVNNFSTPVPPAKRKKSEYDPSEVKVTVDTRELVSDDHLEHVLKRPKLSKDIAESPNLLEIDNHNLSSTGDEDELSAEFSDDNSDDEKIVTSTEKEVISNEREIISNEKEISSEKEIIVSEKVAVSNDINDENISSSSSFSKTSSAINEYDFVDKILLESKKSEETISSASSNKRNISNKKVIGKSENLLNKPHKKILPDSVKNETKVDKCSKSKSANKVESKIEINEKCLKVNIKAEVESTNISKTKAKLENKSNIKSLKINNQSNLESSNASKTKEKTETKNTTKESLKKNNEIILGHKKPREKSEDQTKPKSLKSNKINTDVFNISKTKEKSPKCDKTLACSGISNNSKKTEQEKTQKLKNEFHSNEKQKSQKNKSHTLKETAEKHIHSDKATSKIHNKTKKYASCSSNKLTTLTEFSNKIVPHKQKISSSEHSDKKIKNENNVQKSKREKLQSKAAVNSSKIKKHKLVIQDEKYNKTSNIIHKKTKHLTKVESSDSGSECETPLPSDTEEAIIEIDSDLDEHDTYEECWRIFNETPTTSNAEANPNLNKIQQVEDKMVKANNDEAASAKKRIAHQPNIVRAVPCISASRLSPGQVMQNRFLKLQKMHCNATKSEEKKIASAFLNQLNQVTDSAKKRIAHVPNALLLAAAAQKQKLLNRNTLPSPSPTLAMTSTKGERRIAHIPAVARSNRPIIPAEYGSKVPSNIRQRYLDTFIDECLKFCDTEDEAYQTALEEEKNAFNRSANKTVYLNVAVNTLKRLRNKISHVSLGSESNSDSEAKNQSITSGANKVVSHEYVLGGPKAAKTSFSIEKRKHLKPEETDVKGAKLYKLLKPYIMSEEQLDENGFPRQHPTNHGQAIIVNPRQKKQICSNPLERTCCRCQTKYRVTIKGNYVREEECVHHWGRLWKRRIAGAIDSRYSCCQGDSQSEGCCVAQGHVFEDYNCDNLKGYVKTLDKSPPSDGDYGVYSLDCEMCYSTVGIELTRITVIAPTLKPIYETMVKPENPVLDYNTRFSGITEDHLVGVSTTIGDVQAVLLSLFNSHTILIGHSLESDFKALRLIHGTVVDTSVVFPHKMGLPYKRALRTLMAEYLNKIIQNSVDGHDSQEDALACMELMLWKIKEDVRKANR